MVEPAAPTMTLIPLEVPTDTLVETSTPTTLPEPTAMPVVVDKAAPVANITLDPEAEAAVLAAPDVVPDA